MDEQAADEQRLLFAWLAADDAERASLLDAVPMSYDAETAAHLLALAEGGPSYQSDRSVEARFQRELLALCLAVARRTDAHATRARAARLLAAELADDAAREALWQEAAAAGARAGAWREVYAAERDMARAMTATRRPRAAFDAHQRALDACLNCDTLAAEAAETLGALRRLGEQEADDVREAHEAWLTHARAIGDRRSLGDAHARLGSLLLAQGELGGAIRELDRALALLGEMGEDAAVAKLHAELLVAHYTRGEAEAAMRHLDEVLRLRGRQLDARLDAELDALLANLGGFEDQ